MAKQRYGSGSMVERGKTGSGVWRLRVYVKETERQVQRTFKGSEKEAAKELAKLVVEVEARRFDWTKATVGDLLDKWMAQIEASRRPSTLLGYRRKIKYDIRPALGDVLLAKLRPDQLDRFYGDQLARGFYGDQLARGMSAATVRQMHAIISAACHRAVKWGWRFDNPAERSSPPTVRTPKMTVPEFDEIDALYRAARDYDPVLGTAVALAALTGARRGELCALR